MVSEGDFTQQELQAAQGLVQRKAQGRRITFLGVSEDTGISQGRLKRAFEFLASDPATRRAISQGAGAAISARQLGFGSVREARQFRGFGLN